MSKTSPNGLTIISISGNPSQYSWYRNLGGVFFEVVDMLDYFIVSDTQNNKDAIVNRGFSGFISDLKDGHLTISKTDAVVIATPSNSPAVDPQKELEAQILAMKGPQEAAPVENAKPEKEVKPEHEELMRALGHTIPQIKDVQEPEAPQSSSNNKHDALMKLLGNKPTGQSHASYPRPGESIFVRVTYDTTTSWYRYMKDKIFEVYKNQDSKSYRLVDSEHNRDIFRELPDGLSRTQYGSLLRRLDRKMDAHPLFIKKHHAKQSDMSNHEVIHRLDNGIIPMSL